MLPNTDLKDIMLKTQTTDFFIACKESRIEKNTSFYGCFYLGPFDDSLSQTLANDLRRTLLSELTGLAITSIEIEGVLHKFSSLPGMKESVLDLICNLQNIVLKKTTSNSVNKIFKKTYIGFLNVSGPRVILAKDLKLPSGLQCVDPNQYIATLAEDGVLNMKFNVNEGKNFIKQKPNNLDVNVLKKRNMLLRWSKTIYASEGTKNVKKKTFTVIPNKDTNLEVSVSQSKILARGQKALTKNTFGKMLPGLLFAPKGGRELHKEQGVTPKNKISNPIPLDAVFMPVTKINCIIEENNLYSLASSDALNIQTPFGASKRGCKASKKKQKGTPEISNNLDPKSWRFSQDPLSKNNQYNNKQYFETIYQTCFILTNKIKTKQNIKFLPFGVNIPGLTAKTTIGTQKNLVGHLNKVVKNLGGTLVSGEATTPVSQSLQKNKLTNLLKITGVGANNSFCGVGVTGVPVQLASPKELQSSSSDRTVPSSCFGPNKNFSKIKTFLGTKNAKNGQIYLSNHSWSLTTELLVPKAPNAPLPKAPLNFSNFGQPVRKNVSSHNNFSVPKKSKRAPFSYVQTPDTWSNLVKMPLDYTNVLKLKPLPKKYNLIIEIWTNGSMHPRHALYQSFVFLTNNFLKLQTVKMLGARFRSELAYTNIKYSLLNNYITNYSNNKKTSVVLNNIPQSLQTTRVGVTGVCPKKTIWAQTTGVPISILKISLRSYTLLKKAGILTLNDLLMNTKKDLLNIKNFGVKSLAEIETSLSVLGLKLKN